MIKIFQKIIVIIKYQQNAPKIFAAEQISKTMIKNIYFN